MAEVIPVVGWLPGDFQGDNGVQAEKCNQRAEDGHGDDKGPEAAPKAVGEGIDEHAQPNEGEDTCANGRDGIGEGEFDHWPAIRCCLLLLNLDMQSAYLCLRCPMQYELS